MRVFQEPDGSDFGRGMLTLALGAAGGLAIGMLLSRRPARPQASQSPGGGLRERARTVARRLGPARLRRMAVEQDELAQLEDAVLDAFLRDGVLSERGIDVGAISPGIVELSGSVWTEEEADHAVDLAGSIPGVRTVVNRMDVEEEVRKLSRARQIAEDDVSGVNALQHGVARVGGMGRRRQGHETDPDQPDDSQPFEQRSLKEADAQQWVDEGLSSDNPAMAARPEVQDPWRTNFREDELDNQDPHGKHTAYTLDDAPQEFNTSSRVGEGLKTGEHLAMEDADVPAKPHGETRNKGKQRDRDAG